MLITYLFVSVFSPLPSEKFEMDPVVVHTIKLMQHAKKLRSLISSIQHQQDGMVGIFVVFNVVCLIDRMVGVFVVFNVVCLIDGMIGVFVVFEKKYNTI